MRQSPTVAESVAEVFPRTFKNTMYYKPEGYTSVAPYLTVNGAERTIAFAVDVFGAERLRSYPSENGRLLHAEIRIGDTVVMFTDAVDGWPAIPSHVHVYVPDVDATYKRALWLWEPPPSSTRKKGLTRISEEASRMQVEPLGG